MSVKIHQLVNTLLQIVDENDNNPVFENHSSVLMVKENAPIGTHVMVLSAEDPDEGEYGRITYLMDRRSSSGFFTVCLMNRRNE